MRNIRFVVALTVAALCGAGALAYAQTLEGELQDLNWVGFQQFQEASRVFVRTTEPVKYRVDSSRPNIIELVLENTRIPVHNNTRPLDTQFFDSPVLSVRAKSIEGPSPSVHVEIRMRRKVPWKEVQRDNVLALDFER